MRNWLIIKMPIWLLRYFMWRNLRLHFAGHFRNRLDYWADIEFYWRTLPLRLGPENPVGVLKTDCKGTGIFWV